MTLTVSGVPAVYGLVLADVVRHIQDSAEQLGGDPDVVIEQVMDMFIRELQSPTAETRGMLIPGRLLGHVE